MIKVAQQFTGHNLSSGLLTDFKNSMSIQNDELSMISFWCDSQKYKTPLQQIKFYKKKAKENSPDICVVRGLGPESLYAIIGLKLGGVKKIIVGIHGMYSDLTHICFLKKIFCKKIMEPLILKKSTFFYTVYNNFERQDLIRKYRKKYYGFIYNPVDSKRMACNSYVATKEKKDIINFLYLGRIEKEKGIGEYIGAIEQITKLYDDCFFTFVGSGSYKILSKNHKIRVLPETSETFKFYSNSEVFVLPSYHENLPFSLLEAASYGCYCVATNVGGVSEIAKCIPNCIVIPPKSKDALAEALLKMRKDIGENGFRRFKPNFDSFSFETYCSKMVDVITKTQRNCKK